MIKKIGDGILIFFVLIVVGLGLLGSIGTSGGGSGEGSDQIEPSPDNNSPFEEAVQPPWQATPPDKPPIAEAEHFPLLVRMTISRACARKQHKNGRAGRALQSALTAFG
jgi:hypothetical protein